MSDRGYVVVLAAVVVVVVSLITMAAGCKTVGSGNVGVVTRFGKVSPGSLESGIHLISPLKRVHQMSVRTEEYTMAAADTEGEKSGDDSISCLSAEGLKVDLDITVLYRLDSTKASEVYRELGESYVEKIIRPVIRGNIRGIVGEYAAKEVYSLKRDEVEEKIFTSLMEATSNRGVIVEKTILRRVGLPPELAKAIEDKLRAEQKAQAMEFILAEERQKAEQKRIEAEGIRDAQEIIAAKLTSEYLRWYSIDMMKNLAGSPNTTFLFIPNDVLDIIKTGR